MRTYLCPICSPILERASLMEFLRVTPVFTCMRFLASGGDYLKFTMFLKSEYNLETSEENHFEALIA